MMKKNRGFTLIELLIAIAVLSTMAGVLFQVFAVSGKMGVKARKSEVVQDIAKKTMEELKGYSFETLDREKAEAGEDDPKTVKIAGTTYSYEDLSAASDDTNRDGYLLKAAYGSAPEDPTKAKYLIYAEADRGIYGDESEIAKDNVYSINTYQMPNIADVSSFQNIVLEPQMIVKDKNTETGAEGEQTTMGDALWVAELLEKVNPEEEESQGEGGGDGTEAADTYDEGDIHKFIHMDLKEKNGKIVAEAEAVYTVDTESNSLGSISPELTLTFPLASYNKKIVKDDKTEKPLNGIYLFLPEKENAKFEKLFVTTAIDPGSEYKNVFDLYLIVPDGYKNETENGFISVSPSEERNSSVKLYSNLKDGKLISLHPEEDRLYHLTVTVYEADYSSSSEPQRGEELLKLDSSKSE